MSRPIFIPALELAGAFYRDAVRPLLGGRPHGAALLGWGSDVLGYDTARSTDHGWGPRLQVFLDDPADIDVVAQDLNSRLPERYAGWPVRFGWDDVPVGHHVTVSTLWAWLIGHLGVDATRGFTTIDWLLTPQQRLLGVVAGAVYADDTGALGRVRELLEWYPDQHWRWLLACQWHRLAQEEAFVARAADVGDDPGSAIIRARLVRDMMRLALLLDRRYAPYQKWLGSAFARLAQDDGLPGHVAAALGAADPGRREQALADAFVSLAIRQNASGLARQVAPAITDYDERPARVIMADRYARAVLATVTDPALVRLGLIGGIDQIVDSTDVLSSPAMFRRLSVLYTGKGSSERE